MGSAQPRLRDEPAATGPRRGTPTLADVAARVGVSINTVSRSLRAPQTVRPELRHRIAEALDACNYVPNRLAGGLAGAHTGMVGVIITSLFNSEFAAIIERLQRDLAVAGLSIMIGNSAYDLDEELRLVRAMLSWRPAAVAIVGCDHHPRAVELLRSAQIPVVELWDSSDGAIDSVVGMDHRAIGRLQVEHLMAQGCRRLAFVAAIRPHDYRAQKRLDGARRAVRERLGRAIGEHTAPTGGSADLGDRLVDELLQREPGIDGIVCNSDLLAFGVLRGLHRLGRRVPEDVAVIGFGNNEAGSCLRPSLSTVHPPRAEIGRRAAEVILARLDRRPPLRHELEAELIVRDSTARKMRRVLKKQR